MYHLFRHVGFNDPSKKVFTCMKGNWTVWTSFDLLQSLAEALGGNKTGQSGQGGTTMIPVLRKCQSYAMLYSLLFDI